MSDVNAPVLEKVKQDSLDDLADTDKVLHADVQNTLKGRANQLTRGPVGDDSGRAGQ